MFSAVQVVGFRIEVISVLEVVFKGIDVGDSNLVG
jgi:hypothetical protein